WEVDVLTGLAEQPEWMDARRRECPARVVARVATDRVNAGGGGVLDLVVLPALRRRCGARLIGCHIPPLIQPDPPQGAPALALSRRHMCIDRRGSVAMRRGRLNPIMQ